MEKVTIKAQPRAEHGTRAMRRLRNQGLVPCVVYGKEIKNADLAINLKEFLKALKTGAHLVTLEAPDGSHRVLIKHVQYDHLFEKPIHVDFHKISLTEYLEIDIPLVFKGTPVGAKEEGGVFEEHAKIIKLKCLPENIPSHIEVEVSHLKLHDKLRLKDVKLPEGVKLVHNPETIIAAVAEPMAEVAPATAEAATPGPTEPEVIKKGKKEEEGAAAAGAAPAAGGKAEKKEEKK